MEITRTSLRKKRSNDYGSAPQQTRYNAEEGGGYGRELRESLSSIGQGGRRETPVIKAAAIEAATPTKNTQYIDTEAVRTAMEKLKNLAVQAGYAKDPTDATVQPTTSGGGGGRGGSGKNFFSKDDLSGMSTQQLVDRDNEMYGNTFPEGSFNITPKTLGEKQADKTYEKNRLKEGEKFADRGQREAVNASGFQQKNVRGSAFNTGKDESARPKQTVAALPSDYKKTEAKAFLDAKAYKALKDSGLDKTVGGQPAQVNVGPGNKGTFGAGTAGKGAPSGDALKAGSFGISQAGKDQAAINRGIVAAKKTGIPTKPKEGSFGISQAGRDKAAIQRGVVAAKATGIATKPKEGSFGISEKGRAEANKNRAEAKKKAEANKTTTTPKKAAPAPKKTTPTPSSNKRAEASIKKRQTQKTETKKAAPAPKKTTPAPATNKRAEAAEKRRAAQKAEADKKAADAKRAEAKKKAEAQKAKAEAKKKAESDAKKAEAKKKAEGFKKANEGSSSSSRRRRGGSGGRKSSSSKKSSSKGGTGKGKSSSSKKSNTGSKKASRGAKGGSSSRSRGGSKSGGSKGTSGSKKSSRGAKGGSSSRSRGGTRRGGTKSNRGRRGRRGGRRCDIRCKVNISLLTNMNLFRDDLAELAYFVKDLQEVN